MNSDSRKKTSKQNAIGTIRSDLNQHKVDGMHPNPSWGLTAKVKDIRATSTNRHRALMGIYQVTESKAVFILTTAPLPGIDVSSFALRQFLAQSTCVLDPLSPCTTWQTLISPQSTRKPKRGDATCHFAFRAASS